MKKIIITFLLFTGLAFATDVSAQKVGHINYQEILLEMPGYKTAQAEFGTFRTELETELKDQQDNLQALIDKYKTDEPTISDSQKSIRLQEIQDKKERIEQAAQLYQNDLIEREQKLMEPLLTSIEDAIKVVSKENNFAYVLDISQGLVIYWEGGEDIGPKVRKYLGIPAATPE